MKTGTLDLQTIKLPNFHLKFTEQIEYRHNGIRLIFRIQLAIKRVVYEYGFTLNLAFFPFLKVTFHSVLTGVWIFNKINITITPIK